MSEISESYSGASEERGEVKSCIMISRKLTLQEPRGSTTFLSQSERHDCYVWINVEKNN